MGWRVACKRTGILLDGDPPGIHGLVRFAQLGINETKLGELVAMTLYAKNSAVSFFARGNVCLTALHDSPLAPENRTRLAELVEKLSKTYAQPESQNVDY